MNKKKEMALTFISTAGMFFIGLDGKGSLGSYLTVSELLSNPQFQIGQNVTAMETVTDMETVTAMKTVKYGNFELAPKMAGIKFKDESSKNLKVNVDYICNPPSSLIKGKQVSCSRTTVFSSIFEPNKIIAECPSEYTE